MNAEDEWHLTEDVDHELGRGDPFAAAVRSTRMPMAITNPRKPDNPIIFVNDAFLRLTGYSRDEVVGRNCRFLQGPDTDPEATKAIRKAVDAEESIEIDLLNYRKDGSTFWNALFIGPVEAKTGETQFFFASQIDVTERVEAQQAAAKQNELIEAEVQERTKELEIALKSKDRALEEKTILLHEVDHRVKNNLTMIGSLLRLQSSSISDPDFVATLEKMLERINALSTVHRTLHEAENVRRFDASTFAKALVRDVIGATGRSNIEVVDGIREVDIEAANATALGLIVNELLTNTVKHAFADGRAGRLEVQMSREEDEVVVEITDDGPGFDPAGSMTDTLGRSLILRLSKQLEGSTEWESSAKGTISTTRFFSEQGG